MVFEKQYIKAPRALIGSELRENVVLVIDEKGQIEDVMSASACHEPLLELKDCTLLPGMIDTHIHGVRGHDVMDASHDSLDSISKFLAQNGVTAFVATTLTAPIDKIKRALKQIGVSQHKGVSGATLLGAYLEGPYFTERHKGAQPEYLFRELDIAELDGWVSDSGGNLLTVALAPEKKNAQQAIQHLRSLGIRVMLGHTDANVDQVQAAFSAGANGLVHCYNGMRGLHHRDPGVVGAGLCQPNSYIELIADGHHVHPVAVDLAFRCCDERLMLISDAMQATGMPDGEFQLGEYQVQVIDGIARIDSGGLAGSTLTLINAVKNVSNWLNVPFEQAWLHASLTPAHFLDMASQYGSLCEGKMASMVAISDDHQVLNTWVDGKMVYALNRQK